MTAPVNAPDVPTLRKTLESETPPTAADVHLVRHALRTKMVRGEMRMLYKRWAVRYAATIFSLARTVDAMCAGCADKFQLMRASGQHEKNMSTIGEEVDKL